MSVNTLQNQATTESSPNDGPESVDSLGAIGSESAATNPYLNRPKWYSWPRRHPIMSLLVIVLVAGAGYWFTRGDAAVETRPLLSSVAIGNIENTVTAAGSLQPLDYVDVGAQVSGQLEELFVDVGDVVEEGQILAQIDATVQEQRVEASRASLRAQEAQLASRNSSLKLAKANADRQEMLMKEEATSQQEYDNSTNSLASAEAALVQLIAQIEQSKASLATEEAELGYTKIYAPIAGTVVSILMKEGQTLNATQQAPTVMRIADLTTMTVETEVSEADVGKLAKGMEVYFTTLGGGERRWYGSLRQILPTPVTTNNVVLYTALFDVQNGDGALLSSMTAQVFFVTSAARNVLTVPLGALTFSASGRPADASGELSATVTAAGEGGSFGQAGSGGFDPSTITPEMRERFRQARQNAGAGGGFDPSTITPEMRERFQARMGGGNRQARNSESRPRQASVKVMGANGQTEDREITVGVSSRVSAEVLSGLREGEQVVAGIVQPQAGGSGDQGGFPGGRPPFMMRR